MLRTLAVGSVLMGDVRVLEVADIDGLSIKYRCTIESLDMPAELIEYAPAESTVRDPTTGFIRGLDQGRDGLLESGRRAFMGEAKERASLHSPSLPAILRLWEEGDGAFALVERMEGSNLVRWRHELARAPTQNELDTLIAPLLDALALLHGRQQLHGSISPRGIVVRPNGVPVLTDFGRWRQKLMRSGGMSTAAVFDRGYAALEMYSADDRSEGAWSDVYGVCATLYFLVTGVAPPEATERVFGGAPLALAGQVEPGAYRLSFLSAIEAGLGVAPTDRPQSIAELSRLLLAPPAPSGHAAPGAATPPPVSPLPSGRQLDTARFESVLTGQGTAQPAAPAATAAPGAAAPSRVVARLPTADGRRGLLDRILASTRPAGVASPASEPHRRSGGGGGTAAAARPGPAIANARLSLDEMHGWTAAVRSDPRPAAGEAFVQHRWEAAPGEAREPPRAKSASRSVPTILTIALAGSIGAFLAFSSAGRQLLGQMQELLAVLGLKKGALGPLAALSGWLGRKDRVELSVFSPPAAAPGDTVLVQVFLHLAGHGKRVERLSSLMDTTATLRGAQSLQHDIRRGATIKVALSAKGLEIDEPEQSVVWRGEPAFCQFLVELPHQCHASRFDLVARVSIDGKLTGRIVFRLEADREERTPKSQPAGDRAGIYRYAFVSYASADRDKVLDRVQMLEVMKTDYFLDCLRLSPGDRWERKLYESIDRCDLFLLFWSEAASRSEYVLKETDYALKAQAASAAGNPDIVPVIIEGPPIAAIPRDLAAIHFGDKTRLVKTGL
ncbi:MAG: TIR domain-containing protein [Pseudomonadota bacterium]